MPSSKRRSDRSRAAASQQPAAPDPSALWEVRLSDGQLHGPLATGEVQTLIHQGVLNRSHFLRRLPQGEWKPLFLMLVPHPVVSPPATKPQSAGLTDEPVTAEIVPRPAPALAGSRHQRQLSQHTALPLVVTHQECRQSPPLPRSSSVNGVVADPLAPRASPMPGDSTQAGAEPTAETPPATTGQVVLWGIMGLVGFVGVFTAYLAIRTMFVEGEITHFEHMFFKTTVGKASGKAIGVLLAAIGGGICYVIKEIIAPSSKEKA